MNDDAAAYLSLVLGMWFHTRAIAGRPSAAEALGALKAGGYWTKHEREELVCRFAANGQIEDATETRRAMWDAAFNCLPSLKVPRGAAHA